MPPTIIQTGQRFGRLRIVRELESRAKHRRFECVCDCGFIGSFGLGDLKSGMSTSCGCWRSERATTHGKHRTPEYRVWAHMIARCENPKIKGWHNYGGRGIRVCEEWRESFPAFLAYVGERPSPKHSIDRWPNNDGNYEPGNVRWAATMSEQHLNSRRSRSARGLPPFEGDVKREYNRDRMRKVRASHIARCFRP